MPRQLVAPRSLFDFISISEKKQKNILDAQVEAIKVQAEYGSELRRRGEDDLEQMLPKRLMPAPAAEEPEPSNWRKIGEALAGVAVLGGGIWSISRLLR
jgi:hypothetical protein